MGKTFWFKMLIDTASHSIYRMLFPAARGKRDHLVEVIIQQRGRNTMEGSLADYDASCGAGEI
jgi:hypothetical protein